LERAIATFVMAGLVLAIPLIDEERFPKRDARVKPAHDEADQQGVTLSGSAGITWRKKSYPRSKKLTDNARTLLNRGALS
jgi:hypothetical protein